jgi:hypothetical protein
MAKLTVIIGLLKTFTQCMFPVSVIQSKGGCYPSSELLLPTHSKHPHRIASQIHATQY